MTIETPRLILREFTAEDLPAVIGYYCDPEVNRHMIWGQKTAEEAAEYLAWAMACQSGQPRRTCELAVTQRESGGVIGGASIDITSDFHREAEIGYYLARAHWVRGYATETARALVAFGFGQIGLHRIWATCAPANLASAHVLEKCGMTREGYLRAHRLRKDGTWRDSFLYAILEDEFRASGCGAAQ